MPMLTPRIRKFALTAHVTSSVGGLGAGAAFLALAIAGLASQDAQLVRASISRWSSRTGSSLSR